MSIDQTNSTPSSREAIANNRPTTDEFINEYPPDFTWHELKTFINAGDLGLLKRNMKLEARYRAWLKEIQVEYGSSANYLADYRLQWGKPDAKSLLTSALYLSSTKAFPVTEEDKVFPEGAEAVAPSIAANYPSHFTAQTPASLISIIRNDWPYSVPTDIEHSLIWTRLPVIDHSLVPDQIRGRLLQDGLWGFTGSNSPPPSPSTLPSCLPALAPWKVTEDQLIRSPPCTPKESQMLKEAGKEIEAFIRTIWVEREWETAWFLNPPRLQSVPDVSHVHVFARKKTLNEI